MKCRNTYRLISIILLTHLVLCGSSQEIFTAQSQGPQYAVYLNEIDGYVLGAFNFEFEGQNAIGGRDLFFFSDNHSEIIGGFGVEEWNTTLDWGDKSFGIVQFFGTLFNNSQSYLSTFPTSFAFLDFDAEGSNFLGKIEGELSIPAALRNEESIAVVMLTSDTIYYQDQIWQAFYEHTIVLAEIDQNGTLSLIQALQYNGDLRLSNLRIDGDRWLLSGAFKRELQIENNDFSTLTDFTDGIIIKIDIETEQLDFVTGTGVFDIVFHDVVLNNNIEYYFGEYSGDVTIQSSVLQSPTLDNNVFAYNNESKSFINVGGPEEDIILKAESSDGKLIIGGYFLDEFQVAGRTENCEGSICAYSILMNENFAIEEVFVDDSGDLLLPYSYFLSDGVLSFCGEYSGIIGGEESLDADWICITRKVSSNSNEQLPEEIKIYPNPVSQHLWIEGDQNYRSHHYVVYDLLGKIRLEGIMTNVIDVSEIPSGQYYLKLSNNNSSKVFTFNKI